jgi:hypothetical protein
LISSFKSALLNLGRVYEPIGVNAAASRAHVAERHRVAGWSPAKQHPEPAPKSTPVLLKRRQFEGRLLRYWRLLAPKLPASRKREQKPDK